MQLFAPSPRGYDQVRLFESIQVLGDRLSRHIDFLRHQQSNADFIERLAVPRRKLHQDLPARRVGQSLEKSINIHTRIICNLRVAWQLGEGLNCKKERASQTARPSGGDGGNRTRVRKIRTANVYERSRLFLSPIGPQLTRGSTRPSVVSFVRITALRTALRHCLARSRPAGGRAGRTRLARSRATLS